MSERLAELCHLAEALSRNPRYSGGWHDREDAAQEGRIAAWRSLQAQPEKVDTYHRVVVKRAVIDSLSGRRPSFAQAPNSRHYRLEAQAFDVNETLAPVTVDDYPSDHEHVLQLIDGLRSESIRRKGDPGAYRGIARRHILDGETLKEISLGEGKNRNWAYNTWSRHIKPALIEGWREIEEAA